MINDQINVTGWVKLSHLDANKNIIEQREFKNLVVNTGKNFIAERMKDNTVPFMSHVALGTGTTAPGLTQTSLVTEIGRGALITSLVTLNSIQYTASLEPGVATGAVTEAAIFNNSVGGIMLARTTFAVVNKAADDTIIVNWTITNT